PCSFFASANARAARNKNPTKPTQTFFIKQLVTFLQRLHAKPGWDQPVLILKPTKPQNHKITQFRRLLQQSAWLELRPFLLLPTCGKGWSTARCGGSWAALSPCRKTRNGEIYNLPSLSGLRKQG